MQSGRSQQLIWIQQFLLPSKVTFASFMTEIALRMWRCGSPQNTNQLLQSFIRVRGRRPVDQPVYTTEPLWKGGVRALSVLSLTSLTSATSAV